MIKLENLRYFYQDGGRQVTALNGIDLTIRQGEWVAVTGANGSGKSTLSRLFNALLQPTEGTVTVAGLDLADTVNQQLVKQIIQLVFQNPDAQMIGTTPVEDVAFGLENRGVPRDEIKARIERVLRQVGLEHKFVSDVSALSGGQRQRLAIASCLALKPDCMIFDEATSMLDPKGRTEILRIARELWQNGMTVVWVTQRLEEIVAAPRVLVLEEGKISFDGEAREFFYTSGVPSRLGWDVPAVIQVGYLLQEQEVPVSALPLCEEDLEDLVCELNWQM